MRLSASRVRTATTLVMMLLVSSVVATAAHLYPETAVAWTKYVSATENRIGRELGSPRGFLALDFVLAAPLLPRAYLALELDDR